MPATEGLIAAYLAAIRRLVTLLELGAGRGSLPAFHVVEPALLMELPLVLAETQAVYTELGWGRGKKPDRAVDVSRASAVTWAQTVLAGLLERWRFRTEADAAGNVRVSVVEPELRPAELEALRAALRLADVAGPRMDPAQAAGILGVARDPRLEERDRRLCELAAAPGVPKWGAILHQVNQESKAKNWPILHDQSSARRAANAYRSRHGLPPLPPRRSKRAG